MVRVGGNRLAVGPSPSVLCDAAGAGLPSPRTAWERWGRAPGGPVPVAETAVQGTCRAVRVDRGEDGPGLVDGVRDGGDQHAAGAAVLERRVDVQFGDDERVVEPVHGAGGAEVGLDDGGPPLAAFVRQAVDEADEPAVGVVAPRARAQGWSRCLRTMWRRTSISSRPRPKATACTASASSTRAARSIGPIRTLGVWGPPPETAAMDRPYWPGRGGRYGAATPAAAGQNSTLMNAPVSRKPTLAYALRAGVL